MRGGVTKAVTQTLSGAAARLAPKLPRRATGLQEVPWEFQNNAGRDVGPTHSSESDGQPQQCEECCSRGFQLEPGCEPLSKTLAAPQGQHHSHVTKGRSFQTWSYTWPAEEIGIKGGLGTNNPCKGHKDSSWGWGRVRYLHVKIHTPPSAVLFVTGRWLSRQNYISQHPLHHGAI